MSTFHFQYGHPPKERVKPVNPDIRQYYNPDLPVYGPWKLWQTKPELPSAEEILGTDVPGDVVTLPSNFVWGPWFFKEKYLETHYELIREDSVTPLRNAVGQVRADPFMNDTAGISIYEKVFVTGVTLARAGFALHIQFSTRRAGKNIAWTYSNRLNPGTLIALSPKENAFSSKCVVAVVACRLLEGVEKDPPEVDIFLASPNDIDFDPQQEWIMVEARAGYFEANRHTLTALQKLSKESFPLSEHICSLAKDIGVPEYINAAPRMDFTQLSEFSALDMTGTYDILEKWPAQPMGKLDVSQWVALKRMLTKRLAIIQGPPGTGKTFTSIAALKMMLANKGPNDPPIIIASQTNHALDQLIKHISVFEKNFVRLGGRTTDPEIRKRTPYEIRQNQGLLTIGGGLMASMKTKQNNLTAEIEKLLEPFSRSNSDQTIPASLFLKYGILSKEQFQCLEEVARNWQQPNISANADPLRAWLTGCVTAFDSKYIGDFGFVNDDIDLEYEQLKEIEVEHGGYEDEWSTFRTRFVQLSPGLCGSGTGEISRATIELWLKEKHLYNIHPNCRGSVYGYMRRELIKILGEHLHALAQAYKDCSANFQIGRFERDHCILQKANIIGMTTTGLSKYRGLVSSLNPRVILIEEAAQVLEAPVAVACLPSLQHLILVGDHLQLKGQCADHGLCGRPFYLDVSMFERLMLNKMPYSMLREQRRMVPEIRKLVAPVYGNLLHDHPSVNDHPFIPGMGDKRSFFFDHTSHESSDSLSSKVNDFEASMVVNFLAYLVMNKVPATSITVLTFYNGQKKLIMRKKAQNHNVAQTYVNILTVDSYQGEENDIVILSLVRSNHNRGIGFLQQDNRICVALSRAKYGLYIFGNARCIRKYSDLWRSVTNVMTADLQDPRLGSALPLYCERHNEETIIRSLNDWNAITDGCSKPCGEYLPCGHPCPRKCHGSEHDWVSCRQKCPVIRECCKMPCICVCSPPHIHDCYCVSGKETKTQVFDVGSDWDDIGDEDERDAMIGPIPRTRTQAPIRNFATVPTNTDPKIAESVRKWQAFALSGAIQDDYRRAQLHGNGKRPWDDDTVGQSIPGPYEGNMFDIDEDRRAGNVARGKRPRREATPEQNMFAPFEGDAITLGDSRQFELVLGGKPQGDATPAEQNVSASIQGDPINSISHQFELVLRLKHPEDATTEQTIVGQVQGNLIDLDDDGDLKAEVLGTEEPQTTSTTKEGMANGKENKLPPPSEEDLITFEEEDECRVGGKRPEKDLLTAEVVDDNLADS